MAGNEETMGHLLETNSEIGLKKKKLKKKVKVKKDKLKKTVDKKLKKIGKKRKGATVRDGKMRVEDDVSASTSASSALSPVPSFVQTISIAVPGSIMNNAQSPELRCYLAGQIARCAAVFCVDEVVVFDDSAKLTEATIQSFQRNPAVIREFDNNPVLANLELVRVLQYLETPQYLRKQLFPLQRELKFAGLLNPLDCPHHLRSNDVSCPYREAVVLNKPVKENSDRPRSFCDAGFSKEVTIDRQLAPGVRVTVKLDDIDLTRKRLQGKVVSPSEPRQSSAHYYWGYTVRLASCLSKVFSQNPYDHDGGYDCTIGTSDKGSDVYTTDLGVIRRARHILICFGGLAGLEVAVESDESITGTDPAPLFDHYLNTCPGQGSRTIRTEEAILVSLAALKPHFAPLPSHS